MESLVITKCYSPVSISYWLNYLVNPAADHFMEALAYLERVKPIAAVEANIEFQRLLTKVDKFNEVSSKIMEAVKLYNL